MGDQPWKRINEGDLFFVPLRREIGAVVLVLRKSKRRRQNAFLCVAAYLPTCTLAQARERNTIGTRPVLVTRVGMVPFLDDLWPVIGPLPGFSRERFPIPPFVFVCPFRGPLLRHLDENDPNSAYVSEQRIKLSDIPNDAWGDGSMGHECFRSVCARIMLDGEPDEMSRLRAAFVVPQDHDEALPASESGEA